MHPGSTAGHEKDIVFITHSVPLPPIGGGTRSYHILKSLAQKGNVTLVILNSLQAGELLLLKQVCTKILYFDEALTVKKSSGLSKIKTTVKLLLPFLMSSYELNGWLMYFKRNPAHLFSVFNNIFFFWLFPWFAVRNTYPLEVYQAQGSMNELKEEISRLLKTKGKILFFDFNYFLPAFHKKFNISGHTILSNAHNVEFDVLQQSLSFETHFKNRAWLYVQYKSMKESEKQSLILSDKVFCCSAKDRQTYLSLLKEATVFVVPNGVDTHYFTSEVNDHVGMSLLFTGTMNYFPNQQAVKWFITKIFPLVLEQHPQLTFTIAGKHADKLIIETHPNIRVVANPPDIRPYFSEASVYIVPLQLGGGTRLKILEAAAMGLPVVSTQRGAEGLDNLNSSCIMLADNEVEFARAINLLIVNKEMRNSLASNLNTWVKNWYSWEKIGSDMNEIVFN